MYDSAKIVALVGLPCVCVWVCIHVHILIYQHVCALRVRQRGGRWPCRPAMCVYVRECILVHVYVLINQRFCALRVRQRGGRDLRQTVICVLSYDLSLQWLTTTTRSTYRVTFCDFRPEWHFFLV